MDYPTLLSPIRVGGTVLPNRVIMGSMHTNLEELGEAAGPALAAYYARRARGGVGLIVTGGYAPNHEGRMRAGPGYLHQRSELAAHRMVTDAVHEAGGRIVLQILHSGRYGMHPDIVAPSPIRAPISRITPREMTEADIARTIDDFGHCAALAVEAGYDGVEIMGSEGYLLSQFAAPCTNQRDDAWGGSPENRQRFPLAVARAVRAALAGRQLLLWRLSVLDLIDGAPEWSETVALARALADSGVDLLSTGIGWHESPVPTVQQSVPAALFAPAVARLRAAVDIPVSASNRITTPALAEALLSRGDADLVALARPLLADPDFVAKAARGHADRIVPCIACNQSCLDHYFSGETVSCLVNPAAAREPEFEPMPVSRPARVAVVGAGPAGLAAATAAQRRGHRVILFEAGPAPGGQFRLAARVPGKADYAEVIAALVREFEASGGQLRLHTRAEAAGLLAAGFEHIIIATGVRPRWPDLPGIDQPMVIDYETALADDALPGQRVAIIGAGGIGFDVAATLTASQPDLTLDDYVARWRSEAPPGAPRRQVWMFKRQPGAFGKTLGKTTGWVLRRELAEQGVTQLAGVAYQGIEDGALVYSADGQTQRMAVDTVVCCAGQVADDALAQALQAAGRVVHVVGGARCAAELDAARAFEEGTRIGLRIA